MSYTINSDTVVGSVPEAAMQAQAVMFPPCHLSDDYMVILW